MASSKQNYTLPMFFSYQFITYVCPWFPQSGSHTEALNTLTFVSEVPLLLLKQSRPLSRPKFASSCKPVDWKQVLTQLILYRKQPGSLGGADPPGQQGRRVQQGQPQPSRKGHRSETGEGPAGAPHDGGGQRRPDWKPLQSLTPRAARRGTNGSATPPTPAGQHLPGPAYGGLPAAQTRAAAPSPPRRRGGWGDIRRTCLSPLPRRQEAKMAAARPEEGARPIRSGARAPGGLWAGAFPRELGRRGRAAAAGPAEGQRRSRDAPVAETGGGGRRCRQIREAARGERPPACRPLTFPVGRLQGSRFIASEFRMRSRPFPPKHGICAHGPFPLKHGL